MPPKRSRIACERFFCILPIVQLGELSELRSRRACGLTFLTPRQWVKGDFKKTKSPSALGSWFCVSVKVLVSICSLRSAIPPHYLDRTHGRAIRKAVLRSSCRLAQRSLFETSVNAHYVFLKTSKRVFRKCAFRFSKRNHPRVTKERRAHLYKLKKFVWHSPRVKNSPPRRERIRILANVCANFRTPAINHFCDWIKILSFLLRVDQIPILDIIEF